MGIFGIFAGFRRPGVVDVAHKLYRAAVEQARRPEFYERHGVPDTVAGRFEMIALHVFLLLHRLKGETDDGARLAQALFDVMFAEMDQTLREMGTGDLLVGRRIRSLAEGFYGRIAAYDSGLRTRDDKLAEALQRNLYATVGGAARPQPAAHSGAATAEPVGALPGAPAAVARIMAAYVRREAEALGRQELSDLIAGRARFGPPPAGS
jgi:cytochrome b pre-mRNA-processing protein 3